MAFEFGKHLSTGTATAVAVNIEQDGNLNDLTAALSRCLLMLKITGSGNPRFVGALGSLMAAYDLQRNLRGLYPGVGLDNAALLDNSGFRFYGSGLTGSTWGAQRVGMFAEDSVHLS